MKKLAALCLLALPTAAMAQAPAPATVVTAAQVQALSAQAAAAQGGKPNSLKPIIAAPGYTLNLEHRVARAPAAVHPTDAEWMIVLDGAGTFTVGGKLAPASGGDTIEGGQARHIVKGDMILVPENTPHMLAPDSGVVLVLATLHMPHHTAAAPGRGGAPKLFNAAADLPAMMAKAKAAVPASPRFFAGAPLLSLPPIRIGLEYRSPKGIASVHKNQGEFMYVIAGEGHIPTGGTVTNPKDTGANIDGDDMVGATDHLMKAGDFIFVPKGLPHKAVSDGEFVLATLHVQ
jgi:mannose-6-phosphate isomerase-like protein (cupin superfamily)